MAIAYPRAVVLTGGPCCGKTSLIEELKREGFGIMPEMARLVIDESTAAGSDLVPWLRLRDFQSAVALRQLRQEQILPRDPHSPYWFMDRSVIDGAAYCLAGGINIVEPIEAIARNRYGKVFVLDQLPYQCDDARRENPEQALRIHGKILEAYRMFGYDPIQVPAVPVPERLRLLKANLGIS